MKIAVWDTYVLREDKKIMHFDILVPADFKEQETIFNYGRTYLKTKPFKTKKLTADECVFCHIEDVKEEVKEKIYGDIDKKGYSIIEFENCD